MVFALIALAAPVAALFMDQELLALEAEGGSRRVNVLVAICYRLAGRAGVMAFFGVACISASLLTVRAFRNARFAVARNTAAKGRDQYGG